MGKRWTAEEDEMLLRHHHAVGADFVATHDLGRPEGAGSRRLKFLTDTGARAAFIRAMIEIARFDILAGRGRISLVDMEADCREELAQLQKEGKA